jgi:hypothetical protein
MILLKFLILIIVCRNGANSQSLKNNFLSMKKIKKQNINSLNKKFIGFISSYNKYRKQIFRITQLVNFIKKQYGKEFYLYINIGLREKGYKELSESQAGVFLKSLSFYFLSLENDIVSSTDFRKVVSDIYSSSKGESLKTSSSIFDHLNT